MKLFLFTLLAFPVLANAGIGTTTINPSPAGGVTVSTFTIDLHSGGDVFVASNTLAVNMGMVYAVESATITITGVKCYTVIPSTQAATTFNIAISTDTGGTSTYTYLFNTAISVAASTKTSAWIVPTDIARAVVNVLPALLALHTISIPASGTLPSEYGCLIRYYRHLDN